MANQKNKEPDFYPFRIKDHGWVLKNGASIEEIGEAFRSIVYQLVSKDFQPGSVAETMYLDAVSMMQANSEKARKAANARWNPESQAPPAQGNSGRSKPEPMPPIKDIVVNWAIDNGFDELDAGECWEATKERNGRDGDGKFITNWKGFVASWCNTRDKNRRKAQ